MRYGCVSAGLLLLAASAAKAEVEVCNRCVHPFFHWKFVADNCFRINYGLWVMSVPPQDCDDKQAGPPQPNYHNPCECKSYAFPPQGCGTSVKVSKTDDFRHGILQFEYCNKVNEESFFDLSDVDGTAAGVPGNPFIDAHIMLRPHGRNSQTCTVAQLQCPPGVVCHDAYQYDKDDAKTRVSCVQTKMSHLTISRIASQTLRNGFSKLAILMAVVLLLQAKLHLQQKKPNQLYMLRDKM